MRATSSIGRQGWIAPLAALFLSSAALAAPPGVPAGVSPPPARALVTPVAPRATPIPSALPTPARPARAKPKARLPEPPHPPPPPAPEIRLTLDTPSCDQPWTLHLENAGTVPLRALADARLLSFDILPPAEAEAEPEAGKHSKPKAPHPVRCALPAEMRPRDYEERTLVVPPGRSYVEKLDPRLFCFGAHDAAALVAGARVVPHLVGSREVPAVEPFEEVEPKVASAVDLTGTEATIGPAPVPVPPKEVVAPQPLAVSTPSFVDVQLGWESEIPTTVRDVSAQSVALLFRPETMAFDVTGPSGIGVTDPSPTVRCGWQGHPPTPIAEAYTHLAPKQAASIAILLDALCPDDALRRPGLYLVRARLVTQGTSGASVGVRTFTGEVPATSTTRLRVRAWNGAPPPAPRPQLVDLGAAAAH